MGVPGAFALNVPVVSATSVVASPLSASDIIAQVNNERVLHGLPVFKQSISLSEAANLKVKNIASRGVLEHTQAPQGTLWWPLQSAGYSYEAAGENLSEGIEDVNQLVFLWMNSSKHRINILNPEYSEIGVAVTQGVYKGEKVSFVVEYTAKPKKLMSESKVLGVSTTVDNRAEIIRQLVVLLKQYVILLGPQ